MQSTNILICMKVIAGSACSDISSLGVNSTIHAVKYRIHQRDFIFRLWAGRLRNWESLPSRCKTVYSPPQHPDWF
jgi:hypothetical protein